MQHLLTVTPVVGILPEHHKFEPRPNAGEVDAIFDVPLEMFLKVFSCTNFSLHWLILTFKTHVLFLTIIEIPSTQWDFLSGVGPHRLLFIQIQILPPIMHHKLTE